MLCSPDSKSELRGSRACCEIFPKTPRKSNGNGKILLITKNKISTSKLASKTELSHKFEQHKWFQIIDFHKKGLYYQAGWNNH